MNILFIAPRLPLPADTGGKIRTLNILIQLAKWAKVHLVCFSFETWDRDEAVQLERDGISVTLIPAREPRMLQKITRVLFHAQPMSIAKYYSADMEAILTELNETNDFDAVHMDHIHLTHYQSLFNGIPCVVDEHNVEYRILERCAAVERNPAKRAVFYDQARKMRKFESSKIKELPVHLAVSEDDLELLRELGKGAGRGHVIPNGVDTEYFQRSAVSGQRSEGEEEAVVFTGSMDWLPNDDAVMYFCRDILPAIWKTHPAVKFYIVGKGPSEALKKYAEREPRVILTGRVDDVRTYVQKSRVFVVPLRIGGGTRLKILEAMSMGMPVVSTTIGAEGIEHKNGQNIILADRPEAFAEQVTSLIDDPARCASLGKAGRKLVMAKYDWNIVGHRLRGIYEAIKK